MIIIMAPREQSEHGNSFGINRRGIGRKIRIILKRQIEAGRNVSLFDEFRPQ